MADDRQYLSRLQDYYAKHHVLPSYARVGALAGLRSKASVAEMLARLKANRYLESTPDKRLKPGPRFFERTVAESVRAGAPTAVPEATVGAVTIDTHLISQPSRTILVKVRGDSMIDAGILDGDTVVVEKRSVANIGDIVVAIVDNEFTLKRLARERGHLILRPENKAHPIIRPKGDLEIFGVVVGQFRNYR